MKILVAGGRDFDDYDRLKSDLDVLKPTTIISGMARGADMLGHNWAIMNSIPARCFPADWNRNQQMINEGKPDLVLIYWDGTSKGTGHMIDIAKKAGIKTVIKYYGVDAHNLNQAHELEQASY
jgi:hypothetical protein